MDGIVGGGVAVIRVVVGKVWVTGYKMVVCRLAIRYGRIGPEEMVVAGVVKSVDSWSAQSTEVSWSASKVVSHIERRSSTEAQETQASPSREQFREQPLYSVQSHCQPVTTPRVAAQNKERRCQALFPRVY